MPTGLADGLGRERLPAVVAGNEPPTTVRPGETTGRSPVGGSPAGRRAGHSASTTVGRPFGPCKQRPKCQANVPLCFLDATGGATQQAGESFTDEHGQHDNRERRQRVDGPKRSAAGNRPAHVRDADHPEQPKARDELVVVGDERASPRWLGFLGRVRPTIRRGAHDDCWRLPLVS